MKLLKKLSRPLKIFLIVSAVILLFFPLFRLIPSFADWFTRYPAAAFRLGLGGIASIFPFSLFEIIIGLGILYLLFLLFFFPITLIRKKKEKKVLPLRPFLLAVPVVLLTVLDLYVLTFASSYYRPDPLGEIAPRAEVIDGEDVFYTLNALIDTINETAPQIEKNQKGESVAPDLDQIREQVKLACDAFGERNDFYQSTGYEPKTFLSSPWMTYTHISGIFGFFTGEANINTNYPHFVVTASAAHEICHARGIAPENHCNFLAAVILMESGDPYLRYCGAVSLMDHFISTARQLDRDRANTALRELDGVYWADMAYYSDFFEPYRDSRASEVADTTNSAYLKSMGQKEGTISYSRIIGLTCAYFREKTA